MILSSVVAGQLANFYWVHYILEDDFKADSLGKLVLIVNVLIVLKLAWEVVRCFDILLCSNMFCIAGFQRDILSLCFNFQILNLKHKDAKGMPVIMALSNLLCMTSWLLYGLYLNDFFIYVSQFLKAITASLACISLIGRTASTAAT